MRPRVATCSRAAHETRGGTIPDRLIHDVLEWLNDIRTWKRALIAITLGVTASALVMIYQYPDRVFDLAETAIRARARAPSLGSHVYMTPIYCDVTSRDGEVAQCFE